MSLTGPDALPEARVSVVDSADRSDYYCLGVLPVLVLRRNRDKRNLEPDQQLAGDNPCMCNRMEKTVYCFASWSKLAFSDSNFNLNFPA